MNPGNTPIKRQADRPKVQLIREAEKLTEFSDWFRKTAQKYNPELFEKLPAFVAAPKLGVLLTGTNKAFAQIQEIFAKIVRQAPPPLNSELLHKQKELSNLVDIRKFNITRFDKQQQIFYNIANLLDETITLVTVKTLSEKKNERRQARKEGKVGDNMQATSKTTKRKSESIRDQVFICYSHKDKRWLEDLQIHLKPYVINGSVTAWSDKQIAPGSKWLPEIKVALAHTKVAALLVTPYFLASDFIHENELTPLLKEAEKGDVRIIWIPIRACAYKETPLKDYQGAIDADKPLANMKAERDKAWVKICEEIKKAVNR
ncbi:MAG: toll/interleukin-1 receptor domain-containing protein [Planctomycetes bacterium]|nr:toll/interleukin-1 receptor domain-containing protein [Planctomycetota bacterium]